MNGQKEKNVSRVMTKSLVVLFAIGLSIMFVTQGQGNRAFAQDDLVGKYSGSKKCKKCHLKIHKAFFKENKMAKALESLKKEDYSKLEDVTDSGKYCVECHVTGFGKPGGFCLPKDKGELGKFLAEDNLKVVFGSVGHVGCESCHGPGLKHVETDKKVLQKMSEEGKNTFIELRAKNSCVECHNPHVSHKKGEEVKGTWAKDRGPSTTSLKDAAYIGAEECKSCHESEYDTWSKTGHASAFSVLKADEYDKLDDVVEPKMKLKNPPEPRKCIECHVTGYGKGGFKSVDDAHSKSLQNVQCEVCHGPGSLHKKMADEYKAAGKQLKGVKDQKLNRVPQDVCRNCHHAHVTHKAKYSGRR